MTEFERGFNAGEVDAWRGRGNPLPKVPEVVIGDYQEGYWQGRIPRDPLWARQRRIVPARWDEARSRYMVGSRAA